MWVLCFEGSVQCLLCAACALLTVAPICAPALRRRYVVHRLRYTIYELKHIEVEQSLVTYSVDILTSYERCALSIRTPRLALSAL